MDAPVHEVDPEGDVLLVLRNANKSLDVDWQPEIVSQPKANRFDPAQEERSRIEYKNDSHRFSRLDPGRGGYWPRPYRYLESKSSVMVQEAEVPKSLESEPVPASPAEPVEIRMQLSSRHLMLASPYFRKALSGTWVESGVSNASQRFIHAEGWDEPALLILMNIIHGRTRRVPRTISLETLAKIAIITDYYQFHEPVEVFSEMWIRNLEHEAASMKAGRDLVLWILVSRVFSDAKLFREATKMAMRQSSGLILAPGLPIQGILGRYLVLGTFQRAASEISADSFGRND